MSAMSIDAKLAQNLFRVDHEPHIAIDHDVCAAVCERRACLVVCPADLYELDAAGRVTVNWEGCLECGTCLISCEGGALTWKYPRGGFGVHYRRS
jgi:ferredoxin like protein